MSQQLVDYKIKTSHITCIKSSSQKHKSFGAFGKVILLSDIIIYLQLVFSFKSKKTKESGRKTCHSALRNKELSAKADEVKKCHIDRGYIYFVCTQFVFIIGKYTQ